MQIRGPRRQREARGRLSLQLRFFPVASARVEAILEAQSFLFLTLDQPTGHSPDRRCLTATPTPDGMNHCEGTGNFRVQMLIKLELIFPFLL